MLFCYSAIHSNIMASIDPCYYAILLFAIPLHAGHCNLLCFAILIIVTSPYNYACCFFFKDTMLLHSYWLGYNNDSYVGTKNGNIKIAEEQGSVERNDDSRIAINIESGCKKM